MNIILFRDIDPTSGVLRIEHDCHADAQGSLVPKGPLSLRLIDKGRLLLSKGKLF